jgi:hypothetical protein
MIVLMVPLRPATSCTEPWGDSFALFLFGVLMPKGERVLLGHGSCMGGSFAVAFFELNYFNLLSSVL